MEDETSIDSEFGFRAGRIEERAVERLTTSRGSLHGLLSRIKATRQKVCQNDQHHHIETLSQLNIQYTR
jgi:hypothetical protein